MVKILIRPEYFMMKLGLKEAYYTERAHQGHLHYLCFSYQDIIYEFCSLPFGLSSAPRALQSVSNP